MPREFTAETKDWFDEVDVRMDRTETISEEHAKAIEELNELTTTSNRNLVAMRSWLAVRKIRNEAAHIVDRLGLSAGRELELQEVIDIWNIGKMKRQTNGIARKDEYRFKTAGLIIEARTADAERCFVAVEISYTADERDTNRAIRNAGYITRFTGTPTYAVVAGVFKDSGIDHIVTTDVPQPYDDDRETRVFWSQHGDIV